MWLAEAGVYYYKARVYHPVLGRFMQTDPIGYGDGLNLYAYAGNDPVNWIDPSGKCGVPGAVIGAVIGGAAGAYDYVAGQIGSSNGTGASAGGFLVAAGAGLVGGAIAGGTCSWVGGVAGGVIGIVGNYVSGRIDRANTERKEKEKEKQKQNQGKKPKQPRTGASGSRVGPGGGGEMSPSDFIPVSGGGGSNKKGYVEIEDTTDAD